MKQVQLVLSPYKPEKYHMGLLEYDYWRKRVDIFLGFLDEGDKKRYIGEQSNKSIVKPYLVSPDDKTEKGDSFYHIHTMQVLKSNGSHGQDEIFGENGVPYLKSECRKVIATPEEIGWFVTEHLRDSRRDKLVLYIQTILDNAGKCFVKLDEKIIPARKSEREIYSTVIEKIRKEVEKPLLLDGKVLIYLTEEQ